VNNTKKNIQEHNNFIDLIIDKVSNPSIQKSKEIWKNLNYILLKNNKKPYFLLKDSIDKINVKPRLKVGLMKYSAEWRKDLYTVPICILNKDSIEYLGSTYNFNNIPNIINEYIDSVYNEVFPVRMKKDSLEYFGEVKIYEMVYEVIVDINKKNGLSRSEWDLFLFSVQQWDKAIDRIRNEMALKYLNKPMK
jgi:hypothetical protein